ncbi:MAG: fimbrillin family protein, partial [Bacteroidales bacterium]|nr:fimbrillin family protein [Bacteroidales bacterium]
MTYIILAAAAVTASCTKNTVDLPYGGAISFAPVAEKSTKAIIEGTTYPDGESFKVSAYHGGTDPYFVNLTADYSLTQNGTKLWETSSAQYWPLAGSLTFNAYSPSSASGVTITSAGVTATDYTIQTSAQMTTDLCYASATVADCANHPESVPLVFSHALSQVVFRVKAASYYANTTLTLNSLSIAGIYSVGDFTGSAWENQDTEYTYNLSSTPTNLT